MRLQKPNLGTEYFRAKRAAAIPTRWTIPSLTLNEAIRSTQRPVDLLPRFLSHHEMQITALGAAELASKIRNFELSCIQVAEAFCHRAAVAQQLTNCLTETFFSEAMNQARKLDAILKASGEPVGPLHGVPVSVKDQIIVKGKHTASGYTLHAKGPVKEQDAPIVETLRNAGAVLYCKTNEPQCTMAMEAVNNIYGRTLNPWNSNLGPGGSSGGEGALLGMQGSPLGIGTDVNGSVRVAAAYCGLYGFKPSARRIPTAAREHCMLEQESIASVAGPLGHNVEDLELFLQVACDAKPWLREPLLRMPWRSQIRRMQSQKLAIGIMLCDDVVLPHPYITRVVTETAQKLQAAGHEVLEFKPYEHKKAWDEIQLPLYFADGGRDVKALLAGKEPILASAKRLLDDPNIRERTLHEVRKLNLARDLYRAEYLQHWADTAKATSSGQPMDVLICPAAPTQGTPHEVKTWWGYCSQWNLLDYPSGVLPAGRVRCTDAYPEGYEPANELDEENMKLYDIKLYADLPVTIQVVAPNQEDERLMGAMKVIDAVIRG
ncbi:hypothetical protein UVI_02009900 [Ustilaginoidea virens]|uniref:Amidase domain-containing protein n=1 Tax=Ustilaginoidea virens TaxID=1159556 RepID=A0A1B5L5E9_USTVR|nr:hypothetical protein UVI_02009900 [Ustilaginoidea virens]